MSKRKRRNFCDINPFFYTISLHKEITKRKLKDLFSKEKFSKTIKKAEFEIRLIFCIIYSCLTNISFKIN